MISKSTQPASSRQVYPVAIFELSPSVTRLPVTKSELISLIQSNNSIPFHAKTCRQCHKVPKEEQWMADKAECMKEKKCRSIIFLNAVVASYFSWTDVCGFQLEAAPFMGAHIHWHPR